ncbi:MAG: hypothetical protein FWD44_08825 [Oscillospiraceae bacterium]|nr:hypothetical protein [Oscillospiraceae bacterium]
MSKRSKIRYIATVALSYFLSLFLLGLITSIIIFRTVMNPWYIVGRFERSDFAKNAAVDLHEIFISYGNASGVTNATMASLITPQHIADAAEGSIMETFGVSGGYNFEAYSSEIYLTLRTYAVVQGIEITEDIEYALRDLADLCADALRDYVNSPIFGILAQVHRYNRLLFVAIAALSFLCVVILVLLPFVNRRVTRWIDGYLYAMGGAALACIIIPIAVHGTGITTRLQITPLSYNRFISSWLHGIVDGYIIALIPLILIICICAFIRIVRWHRRNTRYKNT